MHTLHSHPWVHPNVPCSELSRVPCQGPPQRWAKPKFARPWFLLRKSKGGGGIVHPPSSKRGNWWRITKSNFPAVSAVNHRWLGVRSGLCVLGEVRLHSYFCVEVLSWFSRHNTNTTFSSAVFSMFIDATCPGLYIHTKPGWFPFHGLWCSRSPIPYSPPLVSKWLFNLSSCKWNLHTTYLKLMFLRQRNICPRYSNTGKYLIPRETTVLVLHRNHPFSNTTARSSTFLINPFCNQFPNYVVRGK